MIYERASPPTKICEKYRTGISVFFTVLGVVLEDYEGVIG